MAGLLDAFPLVRTTDLDHLRSVLATLFHDSTFDIIGDGVRAANRINYYPLQSSGILYRSGARPPPIAAPSLDVDRLLGALRQASLTGTALQEGSVIPVMKAIPVAEAADGSAH